ncbi:MAG: DEAD/DEAH box helicase [Bdellovibrionales bacterium RIFOXYD12_FULL_39_22]|nr:MAG: DEAD/DEAH box helicase [Bdellovibrionales bacterium RIFOXYB1_FULL_39_21]OFZ44545.1 MAG: DEAD/DEAH box helicase [Bdellovibrionales bacterium RIFOXYC12_FULL_39_17]OFZ49813.1 MAG: DEAD/DEAH box helicase [Bdellovibrionales bacterium RIFOXYC1_FULL_39_130]OFZ76818.1 MAG: DEAD/DEAH box helicase [Bdellovibrionales bacterium RIFOXYD1_FULL_39_84]OFZ95745.1 MAG: DEAD/DEAH box helicase [Bdellovibrionales bacterium RIFOXYD12_FULL_39_22]
MLNFSSLALSQPLLAALEEVGYKTPTPIQTQAIPHLLQGRDLLGIAQTGTGKTAAFSLPILDRLSKNKTPPSPRKVRALILTPTRELAAQILQSFETYGKNLSFSSAVIFGGVSERPQIQAMLKGVDVLVATPGRLLDLMGQNYVQLDKLEIFVLDEADRMLDMGFIHDIKKIIATLPHERQTLLFSATMPATIAGLAQKLLKHPVKVEVTPPASTVERVSQKLYNIDKSNKSRLLRSILEQDNFERVLVFTRTKHGANKVAQDLELASISSAAIHGNKSQGARERALDGFKNGSVRVLVATDIAARGIDVADITHVINYDLPNDPESYVHRIGRTARAGREGVAISFCDVEERQFLKDIERTIREQIPLHPTPQLTAPTSQMLKRTRPQENFSEQKKSDANKRPASSRRFFKRRGTR